MVLHGWHSMQLKTKMAILLLIVVFLPSLAFAQSITSGTGVIQKSLVVTASGATNWTVPNDVFVVSIDGCGGGGSGGGGQASAGTAGGGGGGGAECWQNKVFHVTPGAAVTVTIGSPNPTAGVNAGSSGANGATITVTGFDGGGTVSLTPGFAGVVGAAGTGGAGGSGGGANGGAGGAAGASGTGTAAAAGAGVTFPGAGGGGGGSTAGTAGPFGGLADQQSFIRSAGGSGNGAGGAGGHSFYGGSSNGSAAGVACTVTPVGYGGGGAGGGANAASCSGGLAFIRINYSTATGG